MKEIKIIYSPKKSKNYIATIAIGKNYYSNWRKYILKNWLHYCKRNKIGLVVVYKDLINKNSNWKSPNWQKLLIGHSILRYKLKIKNVCYLDTDILINPLSPNVFKNYKSDRISLVSQVKNIPYSLEMIRRKIAFNRHNFYKKEYPLDSSLFMSLKQIYKYHKVPNQNDYACSGFFIFNVNNHSNFFKKIFDKYNIKTKTLTGGEEPLFNYEVLSKQKIKWLNYKFQALWIYEICHRFPFLYELGKKYNSLTKKCIEICLMDNYFLHFAGSWHESGMWKIKNIFESKKINSLNKKFKNYEKLKLKAKPKGRIIGK